MSISKRVVIHVGFPKTGTTSLQKACVNFPHWDGVCWNIPPEQQESTSPVWQLYQWIRTGIHQQKEHIPEEGIIRSYLEEGETLDRPLLLTSELFSLANDYPPYKEAVDAQEVARRLHRQFPTAKVVMVLRNQLDYLPSLFLLKTFAISRDAFFLLCRALSAALSSSSKLWNRATFSSRSA